MPNPPPIDARVDLSRFNAALQAYQAATRQAWPLVLARQGKLLVRRLIEFTAPAGLGLPARDTVRKNISRDIRRVYTLPGAVGVTVAEQASDRVASLRDDADLNRNARFRNARVRLAWQQRDWPALEAIFANSAKRNLTYTDTVTGAEHHSRRRNGRVPAGAAKTIVIGRGAKGKIGAYVRQIQKKAGAAKAGWLPAARHLRAPFPAWLTGTGGETEGSIADQSADPTHPQIILRNTVHHAPRLLPPGKVQEAVDSRIRDMADNARRYADAAARRAARGAGAGGPPPPSPP